jgi:hypothetical protein
VLELSIDGTYSQHLVLARGARPAAYRVMLGPLDAGAHRLGVSIDTARSAPQAGAVIVGEIGLDVVPERAPEHAWLSHAPVLYARPGSLEAFSDLPLLTYAESGVPGEAGGTYRAQYTVIFSHEDDGTATDRLMATWGRTTDIEFVSGVRQADESGPAREMIQGDKHRWVPFDGPRIGDHPLLWVATMNNMVAAGGPAGLVRFAPAPELVVLGDRSRETVMDAHPWTYAVTSAEMAREGRIDDAAAPGSGRIPDPKRYAVIEACADVSNAALAFDVGVRTRDGSLAWYATDRAQPDFRIVRGGCFRAGAPLSPRAVPREIVALRIRACPRPQPDGSAPVSARVVLRRINQIFMLDESYTPQRSAVHWVGDLAVPADGQPTAVPLTPE